MIQIAQAKHYISNKKDLVDMECKICYQLDPDMLRCKGSCKTIFCLHCITRSKSKNNSCPMRCSEVFQLEKIPNLNINFDCPYEKQLCKVAINDASQFRSHVKTCEYISPKMLDHMKKADQFQCNNNHTLLFLNQQVFQKIYKNTNFYTTTMNQICSLCKNQTICTSICPWCSDEEKKIVFCIACRPLPCTKIMCPIGHLYSKKEVTSKSSVCDFCGVSISIFGKISFRDTICNFDVCENCHNGLPEAHPLVPLSHHHYEQESSEEQEWESQQSLEQGIQVYSDESSSAEQVRQQLIQLFDDPIPYYSEVYQEQGLQDQEHNFEDDYSEQE